MKISGTKEKMASIENITTVNNESEMEEGEIVDDLDDLSDISSEEEFLLRQRLQVLENYNCVLERKKAKRASILSGKNHKADTFHHDLSEISGTDLEENTPVCDYKLAKVEIQSKTNHRQKKTNSHSNYGKSKEHKKRNHRRKRRLEVKVISESSEESEDEYRNKRRKLANAVALNKVKGDISSLKARLEKMMYGTKNEEYLIIDNIDNNNGIKNMEEIKRVEDNKENNVENMDENILLENIKDNDIKLEDTHQSKNTLQLQTDNENKDVTCEIVDLCCEDNKGVEKPRQELMTHDVVDSVSGVNVEEHKTNKQDSDEDLEELRQYALKTKSSKPKLDNTETIVTTQTKQLSEDDDSDTAELRLICLKSALLKKAIEMKVKQKLRKRLKSKSVSLQDDLLIHHEEMGKATDMENNTDIESVDMDIGSDVDDKAKEIPVDNSAENLEQKTLPVSCPRNEIPISNSSKEDEIEEDEDLLRAKLLTSLTKNLPNLAEINVTSNIDDNAKNTDESTMKTQVKESVAEEKNFIINLEDSDSEGEHEATKNLTKMHMKLSEQVDFQQKLDLFLKSTRMKVENTKLPDVVQQPQVPKPHAKYVAKAVNHLPKSEQIEYKNLVKRMAELEKIKQARQTSIISQNNTSILKETLKPRNITTDIGNQVPNINIEERIAASRKNIAEESSKMLKLKEEATKLLQKYKIVATELRNISTAITLNKKEQRTVQNKLSKIRVQHQMLLRSSNFKHSSGGFTSLNQTNKVNISRLQKENNPTKEEHKMPNMLKTVKVSVVNDLNTENSGLNSKLSVQLNVSSNKKVVKLPKSPGKERIVNLIEDNTDNNKRIHNDASKELFTCPEKDINSGQPIGKVSCNEILQNVEEQRTKCSNEHEEKDLADNDYQSPLEALGTNSSNFKHSSGGFTSLNQTNKVNISRLQKENNPTKEEYKMPNMLKTVKVSVVNDLNTENSGLNSKLSVQLNVSSNKKVFKLPESPNKERIVNLIEDNTDNNKRIHNVASKELFTCPEKDINSGQPIGKVSCNEIIQNVEEQGTNCSNEHKEKNLAVNDYQSPLEALGTNSWQEDPNAFLCPYEVGGSCRDPDCKYLHPKIPSIQ